MKYAMLLLYKAAFGKRRFLLWDWWYLKIYGSIKMRKPGNSTDRDALNYIIIRYYLWLKIEAVKNETNYYDTIRTLIAGEDIGAWEMVSINENGEAVLTIKRRADADD